MTGGGSMSHLKIASTQMKKLSAEVDRRFALRMARHLVKVFPPVEVSVPLDQAQARNVPDEHLRPLVNQGIAYAEQHGFVHDDEVALVVVVHAGAKLFPTIEDALRPWAAEVLEREESTPMTRLVWVEHQLAERALKDPGARQLQVALQCTREDF